MDFNDQGEIINGSNPKSANYTPEEEKAINENRAKVEYDATHGTDPSERAHFRTQDNTRFASSTDEGARLHFTNDQIEKVKAEMDKDLGQKINTEKESMITDPKDKHIQELTNQVGNLTNQVGDLTKQISTLTTLMIEQSKIYNKTEDLQKALDPNEKKPINPLEQVQVALIPEQIKKQEEFAKAVEEERIAHDPTYTKTPEAVPITPQETDPNRERKERNLKRAALIAGAVVGGATGIAGGAPTAGIGVLACMGAGILNKGIELIGSRRITKLSELAKNSTNPDEKARLEKKIQNWEKVKKGTEYARSFLIGAKVGLLASGLFSGIFMDGHGLAWNTGEVLTPGITENVVPDQNINPNTRLETGVETPDSVTSTFPSENIGVDLTDASSYAGNSFIKDGYVNLEGSSWHMNRAFPNVQDILPGGELNHSNYTGGVHEMAAHLLGKDLATYQIDDTLLSNLTTYDKHRLLNEYLSNIQSGNTNPKLLEILQNMSTEGAQKILSTLGK